MSIGNDLEIPERQPAQYQKGLTTMQTQTLPRLHSKDQNLVGWIHRLKLVTVARNEKGSILMNRTIVRFALGVGLALTLVVSLSVS